MLYEQEDYATHPPQVMVATPWNRFGIQHSQSESEAVHTCACPLQGAVQTEQGCAYARPKSGQFRGNTAPVLAIFLESVKNLIPGSNA